MIIRNLSSITGEKLEIRLDNLEGKIDGAGLTVLPAVVDPHVHFRIPGSDYKEDWKSASIACVRSGITTVCDMPNNTPSCVTNARLKEKRKLIDAQLKAVDIPLRYHLYLGADLDHLDEIVDTDAEAIKIFMGSSTGTLLLDDASALRQAFINAKGKLIAVHAEDETLLKQAHFESTNPADHSVMRPTKAAAIAVERAIALSEEFNNPLYILHMNSVEELELVRAAKKRGVPVYAEACPHHLFLTVDDYAKWGALVKMNPPLRSKADQDALWAAVADGTIDCIGTDHAPHTLSEKEGANPPAGVPGVETSLPLMLNAVSQGRLTLNRLVEMMHTNPLKIFGLPENDDVVLVDLNLERTVEDKHLYTKCGWSPFSGRKLKGWPVYTVCRGRLFSQQKVEERQQPNGDDLGGIGEV